MKKYKLTDEAIKYNCVTLYRIEALRNFGSIKAGDKGGFVQSYHNLSQEGDCWIHGEAKVFGNAKVYENAQVFSRAEVCGHASVKGDAFVFGRAEVYDWAKVYGKAQVFDDAKVYGNASINGDATVYDKAEVFGVARVYGNAFVKGDAIIETGRDYIVFKNWWSSGRYFTWTRSNNMWNVGCFYGTGKELIKKAYADSEDSGKEYERVVRYVESILAD
nr:MAG TPA: Putative transferase, nesg, ydcK, Structural Genomics.38A [Caudoviricetes sp.]